MSCITKILETKGDKEFLVDSDAEIAIEGGGTYKGYEYLITFTSRGHRCGYVAIPESHPTYHSKEDYPSYCVHGGVTFFQEARFEEFTNGHKCTDKWIGFDAMHGDDKPCMNTADKYFGVNGSLQALREIEKMYDYGSHKSFAYMKNECRKLIQQLIKEAA